MTDMGVTLPRLAEIAATDVGRGTARLAQLVTGGLERSVWELSARTGPSQVVLMTGFFIPTGNPAAAETDGPLGAVQLAVALEHLGHTVRLLTDERCERAVRVASAAAGVSAVLDVAPRLEANGSATYRAWEESLIKRYAETGTSCLIAIERVGPNRDGRYLNMRAADISAWTAPLDRIFTAGTWTRIGIGDGGNEIGMGSLPSEAVARLVPNGAEIHCVVPADHAVVSGTSNWGAAALVAGLAVVRTDQRAELLNLLRPAWSSAILNAMITSGASVDGVTGKAEPTVDGLSRAAYERVLSALSDAALG